MNKNGISIWRNGGAEMINILEMKVCSLGNIVNMRMESAVKDDTHNCNLMGDGN